MLNLTHRSTGRELMDDPHNFSNRVMAQTYRQINFINKYLLGDLFILKDIEKVVRIKNLRNPVILDLGCGNGDLLHKINTHLKKRGIVATGIGYDPYLDTTGVSQTPYPNVRLYQDWDELIDKETIDISTTSLTLHHLYDGELDKALHRLLATPRHGFVISDLMRSPLAYALIWGLTRLFGGNKLVRHDAPLSVARGFSKADMLEMQKKADGFGPSTLRSTISFRWMLTGIKPA